MEFKITDKDHPSVVKFGKLIKPFYDKTTDSTDKLRINIILDMIIYFMQKSYLTTVDVDKLGESFVNLISILGRIKNEYDMKNKINNMIDYFIALYDFSYRYAILKSISIRSLNKLYNKTE